jgi:glycosyltransferase involved in cell wall biosynthesis
MTSHFDAANPVLTVVVCTHNRASMLAEMLETLVTQRAAPASFEVLVVDNRSTDATRSVVESFTARLANLRYCYEETVGLSAARNLGWREARGLYVGYTDDDCRLPPQWVQVALRIIEERSPDAFGGPYTPFYTTSKPAWFRDSYRSSSLSVEPRFLGRDEFLTGANFFFRRSRLQALGGFDLGLGMSGHRVAWGEDPEIQKRLDALDPAAKRFFHPELSVMHHVAPRRLTLWWTTKAQFAKGRDVYLVTTGGRAPLPGRLSLLLDAAKTMAAFAVHLVAGAVVRDRVAYPFFQNYYVERLCPYLRRLGRLDAQIRGLRLSSADDGGAV